MFPEILNDAHPIFVYGTLMRGRCRQKCWPHPPLVVLDATTRGRLYDLGAYPGLMPGDDTVRGELWWIRSAHLAETFRVLDAIEGYQGKTTDFYTRVMLECQSVDGRMVRASTYHYARPLVDPNRMRVVPGAGGECAW